MNKAYKISYKPFFNDRLKEVQFHGKSTYPLYIQVIYRRKTILFKSYYFELFSKKRYELKKANKVVSPSLHEIAAMEVELMDYITLRLGKALTIESFKNAYYYFGKDLCESTEEKFRVHMFTFFLNKKMGALAHTLAKGSETEVLQEVLLDLKKIIEVQLYNELVISAIETDQPYIPLYEFMTKKRSLPMQYLTVKDWETGSTAHDFSEYLDKNYEKNKYSIEQAVKNWINLLKKGSLLNI